MNQENLVADNTLNQVPKSKKYIALEGIDRCGKGTVIEKLKNDPEIQALCSTFTREPGGSLISEMLREVMKPKEIKDIYYIEKWKKSRLIKYKENVKLSPQIYFHLMNASRYALFEDLKNPSQSHNIISDRSILSTFAMISSFKSDYTYDRLSARRDLLSIIRNMDYKPNINSIYIDNFIFGLIIFFTTCTFYSIFTSSDNLEDTIKQLSVYFILTFNITLSYVIFCAEPSDGEKLKKYKEEKEAKSNTQLSTQT